MYLVNISNTDYDLDKFDNKWGNVQSFLAEHSLDGLELILHQEDYLDEMPENMAKGLHLKYFPTWLEFYKEKKDKLKDVYGDADAIIKCFGGLEAECLVETYKKEYLNAKKLKVKYMVYHVAHVTTEHAFNMKFDYDDDEVLDATAEIINKAFDDDSDIMLLFENLWWPGMNLLSRDKTKRFLDKIQYKNKGIMLDLSHLLITKPGLRDLNEGTDYIIERLAALGDLKDYIKGIHVNSALPDDYLLMDHTEKYQDMIAEADPLQRYFKTIGHIRNLDWHVPYDHHGIREIIDYIGPDYIVYEVLAKDLDELNHFMKVQNEAVGR